MSKTKSSNFKTSQPGRSKEGSAHDLTRRNVELIRKLEQAAKQERSRTDLVAEAIANFCGSMIFVLVHVVWFVALIIIYVSPVILLIDPFPFTSLTLVVSLEAI